MAWTGIGFISEHNIRRMFFIVVVSLLFCPVISTAQKKIECYSERAVSLSPDAVRVYVPEFKDTLSSDTLYQVTSADGMPVSYYRKIHTSVCFDNKCRSLHAIVHWNVTGRYLGIELPPGEYLSKKEHEPFTNVEYRRLHTLLSDANSPLGGFSYNELVPRQTTPSEEIDAVSSPTAKHLLEYVVEGAAFTTYKLWHIVYGTTRDEVSRLTAQQLSLELLLDVLGSPVTSDKLWALSHRRFVPGSSRAFREGLLDLARSPEYNLAERAINAVDSSDLRDTNFQVEWVTMIQRMSYSLRKPAILKMQEAPQLDPAAADVLVDQLTNVNGELVATVLSVLARHGVFDLEICRRVSDLLSNPNLFISRHAYDFLVEAPVQDKVIRKRMASFKKEHSGGL